MLLNLTSFLWFVHLLILCIKVEYLHKLLKISSLMKSKSKLKSTKVYLKHTKKQTKQMRKESWRKEVGERFFV